MRIRPRWHPWRAPLSETLRCQSSVNPSPRPRATPLHKRRATHRDYGGHQIHSFSTAQAAAQPQLPQLPPLSPIITKHSFLDHATFCQYRPVSTSSKDGLKNKSYNYVTDYIRQLDVYLHLLLRQSRIDHVPESPNVNEILTILGKAQADRRGSVNLFSRMVLVQGRSRAALYLVDKILKHISLTHPTSVQQLSPAHLWPGKLTFWGMHLPIDLPSPQSPRLSPTQSLQSQYDTLSSSHAPGLAYIWRFLGSVIIESANLKAENAAEAMSVVYQTLAKLHHMGLIPENIYNHSHLPQSSVLQRPPILHLLSSRILTTLSDATWRSYQDDIMLRDAENGVDYRQTQDPPGGRFRVKVRGLGPEIWLEFILWCCVESNCSQAGASLISLLANQASDPWFAVNWANGTNAPTSAHVDWERVKSRTGGTVGRIEGYSSESPLVEVPSRTISVEVVLALVESSINALSADDGTSSKATAIATRTIRNLVGFLEPHNLSEEYFDFLTARLVQATSTNILRRPLAFGALVDTITQLRSLQPAQETRLAPVGMSFRSIIQQSELYAGVLHLTLHTFACTGHVRETIQAFDHIQSMVDSSKMQSIASFIDTPPEARGGFFSAAPMAGNKDFTMSHGQIPYARLATFLNLLTENNITSLAEWLIYSTDADGPLLPGPSFQRSSVAAALVRFAGANDDPQLLRYVLAAMRFRKLRTPPVSLLRWLANAQIQCLNFAAAEACLNALRPAIAGGYHPDNLACIAASILQMEAKLALQPNSLETNNRLTQATSLMADMLNGRFTGNPGDFYIVQRRLFNQQLGHILRICESVRSPTLNDIASRYRDRFSISNAHNLSARSFNILLRGIVEHIGPKEAVRIWELFCEHPADVVEFEKPDAFDARGADSAAYFGDLDFAGDMDETAAEVDRLQDEDAELVKSQATNIVKTESTEIITPQAHILELSHLDTLPSSTGETLLGEELFQQPFREFFTVTDPDRNRKPDSMEQTVTQPEALSPSESPGRVPVVVPNVQSLRIIINKIITDSVGDHRDYKRDIARTLLKSTWAHEQFHIFGLESEHHDAFTRIKTAENDDEDSSSLLPLERISFGGLEREFVAMLENRGSEVSVGELFAREDEMGWVTRMPRVDYRGVRGWRRREVDRDGWKDAREFGWLYERMARRGGDGNAFTRVELEQEDDDRRGDEDEDGGDDGYDDERMFKRQNDEELDDSREERATVGK